MSSVVRAGGLDLGASVLSMGLIFEDAPSALPKEWLPFSLTTWGIMLQRLSDHIRDCYERADECAEQAAQASDEIRKADFITMKRSWVHLARTCEFMERLERFLLESYRVKVQGGRSNSN